MVNKVLTLAEKLISIPSTKENPSYLRRVLALVEKELVGFTVEHFEKNCIPSILVYPYKRRPKRFKVIFNAHLDVVEAGGEQFKPYKKDDRLYGRGAYDMKAAAAVEILVFKELAKKLSYPVGLQIVTDEELGGFGGTKYQIEKGVMTDFVIAGEPTDLGINNQAKGIIWAKIKTKGRSAHGAYPWRGKNALWSLIGILNEISKDFPLSKKEVWQTTVNLAGIKTSNQTFNKVPDEAEAFLDIRYIPQEKEIIVDKLEKLVGKGNLEIILKEPPQFTDEKNSFVLQLKKSVEVITGKKASTIVKHGGSDVRHFNFFGIDGVTFGPVGGGAHSDNEWVSIKSIEDYYHILKRFLVSLQ